MLPLLPEFVIFPSPSAGQTLECDTEAQNSRFVSFLYLVLRVVSPQNKCMYRLSSLNLYVCTHIHTSECANCRKESSRFVLQSDKPVASLTVLCAVPPSQHSLLGTLETGPWPLHSICFHSELAQASLEHEGGYKCVSREE